VTEAIVLTTETGRVRDPDETLRRLVEAALAVLGQRGYERATVDEIVERAGYSKGAFYTHFKSKEDLFLYLLESRLANNRQRFETALVFEGSAATRLQHAVETILGFAQENPGWRALSVEFMAHGMRNERIAEHIGRVHHEWREVIAGLLRDSTEYKRGQMAVDPDDVAACVVALLDGFIIQCSMEPERLPMHAMGVRLRPLIQAWFQDQTG
jgi:AcrR family transcriptional regulator